MKSDARKAVSEEQQLGQLLVRDGLIALEQLNHALHRQKREEKRRRLGDILVELGYMQLRSLRKAVAKYGKRQLFGELLVRDELVTREQLDEALQNQKRSGKPLGQVLIDMELMDEEQLAQYLGQQLDIAYLSPQPDMVDRKAAARLPAQFMRKNLAVLMSDEQGVATVLVPNPNTGLEVQLGDLLRQEIEFAVGSPTRVRSLVDSLLLQRRFSARPGGQAEQARGDEQVGLRQTLVITSEEMTAEDTGQGTRHAFDYVVWDAIKKRASDIHIEPRRHNVRVRYRIDGTLTEQSEFPLHLAAPLVRRAAALSNIDLGAAHGGQESRILAEVDGEDVDLRIAMTPTVLGHAVVARIFSRGGGLRRLDGIGMEPAVLSTCQNLVDRNAGLTVFAGPRGTGKSTSLYATLLRFSAGRHKIITFENPVEFALDDAIQVEVPYVDREGAERLVASARHHDADIIALGECTNSGAGDALLRAAVMGYRVFFTLHAEDSAAVLQQLVEAEGDTSFLASCPLVVVTQRLVRRVCEKCAEDDVPSPEVLKRFGICDISPDSAPFQRGAGCPDCRGTGYHGRTGVFEMLAVDADLRVVLLGKPTSHELRAFIAGPAGILTLGHAAFLKAAHGITSLDEARRVLPVTDFDVSEIDQPTLADVCRRAGIDVPKRATEGATEVVPKEPQKDS